MGCVSEFVHGADRPVIKLKIKKKINYQKWIYNGETQARGWCFTAFNYDEQTIYDLVDYKCLYIMYQTEICPETKRPHLQGWVHFKSPKMARVFKKDFLPKLQPHFEPRKGTPEHNAIYCTKKESADPNYFFYERGDKPSQGERTDLKRLKDEIEGGAKVRDILMDNPAMFHQYGRTIQAIEDRVARRRWRSEMTTCSWYVGETGAGKSHIAFEGYDPDTHYDWADDGGWHDGYEGQETVIINEFRAKMIPYCQLLKIIDKWPMQLRRRNRTPAQFLAKHIIITCPMEPEECYYGQLHMKDSISQLLRRINVFHVRDRVATLRDPSSVGDYRSVQGNTRVEHFSVVDEDLKTTLMRI